MLHFECKCCIECPSRASDPNYYYCYCYWCANYDVQMSNSTLINYIPQPFLSNRFESMSRSMCRFSFLQQSCVLHHCVQQVCQNIWIRAKNPNLARAQTFKMKKKPKIIFKIWSREVKQLYGRFEFEKFMYFLLFFVYFSFCGEIIA